MAESTASVVGVQRPFLATAHVSGLEVGQRADVLTEYRNAEDPAVTPVSEWRDPDSNWGHHDFQTAETATCFAPEALQITQKWTSDR